MGGGFYYSPLIIFIAGGKRMEQHIEQRSGRTAFSNWGGALLLIVGTVFLWITVSPTAANNWWAFFIMVGGLLFVSIARAVQVTTNGRFPFLIRSNLGISLIILTVASMFLFNLDWVVWWPLMISVPGIALLYISGATKQTVASPVITAVSSMSRWIGSTITVLGFTFLLDQLGVITLNVLFIGFRWWGLFILSPALGAFINAWKLRRSGYFPVTESAMWMTGLLAGGTAVKELLGLDWSNSNTLISIWLILFGLVLLFTARRRV